MASSLCAFVEFELLNCNPEWLSDAAAKMNKESKAVKIENKWDFRIESLREFEWCDKIVANNVPN